MDKQMDKGTFGDSGPGGPGRCWDSPEAKDLLRMCPWGFGEGCTGARLTMWLDHKGLEEVEGQWPRKRLPGI